MTPDVIRDLRNDNAFCAKGPNHSDTAEQCLNPCLLSKENPSAPEGAAGYRTAEFRARAEAATALAHAIAECDPEDAETILAGVLAALNIGPPLPPFLDVMEDATWWAGWASFFELRAYAVACFQHMPPKMQADFASWAARQIPGVAR